MLQLLRTVSIPIFMQLALSSCSDSSGPAEFPDGVYDVVIETATTQQRADIPGWAAGTTTISVQKTVEKAQCYHSARLGGKPQRGRHLLPAAVGMATEPIKGAGRGQMIDDPKKIGQVRNPLLNELAIDWNFCVTLQFPGRERLSHLLLVEWLPRSAVGGKINRLHTNGTQKESEHRHEAVAHFTKY